ncbi:MAG TPA: hypothetical protein VJY39_05470 [Acidisphaera sp.]|nr:hypothetical protein [Acidisphaera sp.]
MSHVQHDGTAPGLGGAVTAAPVPVSMMSRLSVREPGLTWRQRLAKPIAVAAVGLFYGLLFTAVVILPLAVVVFGLVILFG